MDPATLTLGETLLLASSAVSGVMSLTQGIAANRAAGFNAALAEREAEQTRAMAAIEEDRHRDNLRRFMSSQRAAAGASGIDLGEGPYGLLAEDAAREGERDALLIRYSGEVAAARSLADAALQRFQGRLSLQQGVLGAGAGFLKGAAVAGGVLGKTPKKTALGAAADPFDFDD